MLSLRPYQREAVQSIYDYFGKEKGNPLVVLPTGSGKSLVMADFIKGVMSADPNHRILVVTHVKELIQQNFQELLSIWPEAPAGVYSAGLNSRNTHARVLFCGIQSIHNKVKQLEWAHLIIIDEAHLLPNSANTRYRNFINDMLRYNPRMKVIGLTATPYRLGTGSLHKGKDALFTDICHDTSVLDLIDQGYLAPLITKKTEAQIDVSDVHKRGGEFIEKELQAAVNKEAITKAAIKEVIDYGKSRRSWIVFASGVDHAKNINEEIASYGIKTACILGSTPKAERDRLIQAYKRFDLQCLVSMGVLTTGFNAPSVDLIANLRPTQSAGLYVQMCGRGMRKAPGKRNCIVLDFAGNIERHGPIDAVTIEDRKSDEPGEAPVKACPECGSFVKIQDMQCPDCGFEFPPPEPEEKIQKSASKADILTDRSPKRLDVAAVLYSKHNKVGAPPSMLVQYRVGFKIYKEWVPIEHPHGRRHAVSWWQRRTRLPIPSTTDRALEISKLLTKPKAITIDPTSKHGKVIDVHF